MNQLERTIEKCFGSKVKDKLSRTRSSVAGKIAIYSLAGILGAGCGGNETIALESDTSKIHGIEVYLGETKPDLYQDSEQVKEVGRIETRVYSDIARGKEVHPSDSKQEIYQDGEQINDVAETKVYPNDSKDVSKVLEDVWDISENKNDSQNGICTDNDPSTSAQIAWLKSQSAKTGLVDSYQGDEKDNAYTYDQALAAIAFTEAGEVCEARAIFKALASLQQTNGSWKTSYGAENGSACEPYVYTNPVSWVVMSLNYYEAKTDDEQFSLMANKAMGWLDTMTITEGETKGTLIYGEDEIKVSTTPNCAAYSAYFYRGQKEKAEQIKKFLIQEMWAPSPISDGPYHDAPIFWRGLNDFAWCTDPQSWGVLALGSDYAKSLGWLDTNGYGFGSPKNSQQNVEGFSFCTEDINPPNEINPNFCGGYFVWLEGTEGVAAAYYSIGDKEKGDYYHSQTAKIISTNGGVPYSISNDPLKWPCNWPYESVTSTAWYYFNEAKINPFQPF